MAVNKRFRKKRTIPYKFGEKHKRYIRRCAECTINVAEGAVRAGKTVDHILAFCNALKTTKDKIHLASASTIGNAKIILGDCNGFGIEHYFRGQCRWGKYKGNEALIIKGPYTNYKERIIIFAGSSMENSFKFIRGNSYGMWIATEINLHAQNFVQEAFNRTIAAIDRKIFWDLNPDRPKAWIYTEYIDKYAKLNEEGSFKGGYNYAHFTIDDNVNISEQRKAEIKSQYDVNSIWYKRDISGLRCAAEGAIFEIFANNPEMFTTGSVDLNRITSINIGIDFGGNESKTVFVATAFLDGFKELIVIDEHKIDGGKGDIGIDTICKEFIAFVKKLYRSYNPVLIKFAWADNENQAAVNSLRFACRNARLFVKITDCYKAPVKDRITVLSGLMAQNRFKILKHCANVCSSLSEQIWDPKAEGKTVRLDDGSCDIDTADALEYSFSKFIIPIIAAGKGAADDE